jgi:flagellar hook-associated protein 1 FlgK
VNTQQASGIDANGISGAPIFGSGGSANGAANAISVVLNDPNGVAASASGAGSQDGSNATALAALASAGIVGGQPPSVSYAALVGSIGTKVSEATIARVAKRPYATSIAAKRAVLRGHE